MPNDYTADFREQVLRRVAERNDLGAVAREFGVPSDLLFAWLKEAVDDGRRLDDLRPPKTNKTSAFVASDADSTPPEIASWTESTRGSIVLLSVFLGSAVVLVLTGSLWRLVVASHAFQGVMVTSGFVIGVLMFGWLMRLFARDLVDDDAGPTVLTMAVVAMMAGTLCGVTVWMWTLALPSFPHHFFRQPVEVRTVVAKKSIWYGRGRIRDKCSQITTAVFDPRFPAQEFCVSGQQYNDAHVGETLLLHGSASWFGFERDGFELVSAGK